MTCSMLLSILCRFSSFNSSLFSPLEELWLRDSRRFERIANDWTRARRPWNFARDLLDRAIHSAQFITNFDNREANHTGIERQEASYFLLRLDAGIELHHKVMALMVLRLVLCCRARKVELSPVLHAPNYSSRIENLLSGHSGDPV